MGASGWKKEKRECYALWAKLIGYVAMQADSCEHTHDARLSNSIRGVVFECMRSFMMITEFLIQDGQIEAAEKCINAMQDYYDHFQTAHLNFLKTCLLINFH